MAKKIRNKENRKHYIIRTVIIALLIGLIVWGTLYILAEQDNLVVTKYTMDTDKFDGTFKVTVLSDLHNKEFGEGNEKLLDLVSKQDSDIIACLGDFVVKGDKNTQIAYDLYKNLKEIAPVYAVLGNHETYSDLSDTYIQSIKDSGVNLLDDTMTDIKINEKDSITIGGLRDYPYYEFDAPDYNNADRYFFEKFCDVSNYKLLLTHKAELFMWKLKDYPIDLMLCGHTHGGCFNVPFIGPLYAPNQGFFPQYAYGEFSSDTCNMIITSGLGSTYFIPRINIDPEIVVVTINGTK